MGDKETSWLLIFTFFDLKLLADGCIQLGFDC